MRLHADPAKRYAHRPKTGRAFIQISATTGIYGGGFFQDFRRSRLLCLNGKTRENQETREQELTHETLPGGISVDIETLDVAAYCKPKEDEAQ